MNQPMERYSERTFMKEKTPENVSICGTCAQPTLCSTRRRYIQLARKYTTKATPPMMAKTPSGETLLEACGGGTVGQARLVLMSNTYTQSNGAERKFSDGYKCSVSFRKG